MVCDFAHHGFTAATPLPNQGFPARFLGDNGVTPGVITQIIER